MRRVAAVVLLAAACDVPQAKTFPDASVEGDDSLFAADPVELDSVLVAAIDQADDHDWYRFTIDTPGWYMISAHGESTEIVLRDEAERLVAQSFYDLRTYLVEPGTYYVRVASYFGETGSYTVRVSSLVTSGRTVIEREAGGDVASAQPLPSGDSVTLCGRFEDALDVDVFTVTATEPSVLWIWPDSGNGSTTEPGSLWITDGTGATTLARIDDASLQIDLPLTGGDVLLWVSHPPMPAGSNDFYVLWLYQFPGLAAEAETAPGQNDTIDTSTEEMPLDDYASFYTHLPDGDIDYLGLTLPTRVPFVAICDAYDIGSGVRGLSLEIRDDTDAVLTRAPGGVYTSELQLGPGKVWFRLAKTAQADGIAGDQVRCYFTTEP
jgi:hypothetical protein